MKCISFDVGIKNLAYCILDIESSKICHWGILNISTDLQCQHIHKGKQCDKSAKFIDENNFLVCNNHKQIKKYQDNKFKKCKKKVNPIFDMGKHIISTLNNEPYLSDIEYVLIENQPALKNPVMKTVQMIVYSYYLTKCLEKDQIKNIEMINARNKLKAYQGPDIKCDITDKYKKNKWLAIKYCEQMISQENSIFQELFNSSKKKDDLSDSYLQGVYWIQKNHTIK